MKVFLTGATGVLGRPVLRGFVSRDVEVLALARSKSNEVTIAELGGTPVAADLFDADELAPWLKGCDAVLHLATSIPDRTRLKSPDAWKENDRLRAQGTRALVDAALATATVRTFLYPGICFMYADEGANWQSAQDARILPPAPLRSTLAAEREVSRFAAAGGVGITLRFGAFYGPASRDSVEMLAMARKGFVLPLAPLDAYRSLIWIDDAASAVLAGLGCARSGVYDVVEDNPYTQEQSIHALADAVGRRRLVRLPRLLLRAALPAEIRQLLERSQRVSAQAFRQATGWAPQVPDQSVGWRLMTGGQAEQRKAA